MARKGMRLYAATTNRGVVAFTKGEVDQIEDAAARIVGYYASASDDVRSVGAGWYSAKAATLAHEVADRTGITFEQAAAVVAICSPRTRWTQQVNRTADFVEYVLRHRDVNEAPKASLYWARMELAALGLLYDDWRGLNGPKVGPFYRNICGDYDLVTLDVWAIRAGIGNLDAGEDEVGRHSTGRARLILEAAYHLAAEQIGEQVAAVQAVVWVVVRGGAD